jgi:hypothetical protein
MRGNTLYEEHVWTLVLQHIAHALPDDSCNDLIDRNISLSALGHSRQSALVLMRLVPFVDEVLLTVAIDLYTNPQKSDAEFGDILHRYSSHYWLLQSLAHQKAPSTTKEKAFLEVAKKHQTWSYLEKVWKPFESRL